MIKFGNLHLFYQRDLFQDFQDEIKNLGPSGYFQRPDGLVACRSDSDCWEAVDLPEGWVARGNFVEDAAIAAIDSKKRSDSKK